jgi:6-phosphogluconate dehydrogenase
MIPAGAPVDEAIASLKPYLQNGDIIVDGGNSFFADTERRVKQLEEVGILFVGMGVSGGESGARLGPSLMPGGSEAAWDRIKPMMLDIAAKAPNGEPCIAWMGRGGAGHYVKMVHNGIEYADMQLIAEVYDLLHRGAGLSNAALADIFDTWNKGKLQSYLIGITARILRRKDGDMDLVDLILDEAAQKGTGKWTLQNSFDVGAPIPTINAAVKSRILSSLKSERVKAALLFGDVKHFEGDRTLLISLAEQALYACKIVAYAQGFAMFRLASAEYGWGLDLAAIARIWRAGCIIRARLLEDVADAFAKDPNLPNLLIDHVFAEELLAQQDAWRETAQVAIKLGIPIPAITSALAYFDGYRSAVLPTNLTQAQRDYFGAHTYRRVDQSGNFHTEWEV